MEREGQHRIPHQVSEPPPLLLDTYTRPTHRERTKPSYALVILTFNFLPRNFTEALRCYTEGIALNPESQILYSNRSAAFLSLKRLPLALNDAKRAVELAPGWAKAYRRKASVLDAMKRYQEAKLVYEKALEVVKTDDSLSDSAREKDAAEVKGMIESEFCFHSFYTIFYFRSYGIYLHRHQHLADRQLINKRFIPQNQR